MNLLINQLREVIRLYKDGVSAVISDDAKVAKLYLRGTIRQPYPWEDEEIASGYISAKRVQAELDKIVDQDLEIYLNSGGGDVFESIEIRNMLKEYKGNLKIIVTGRAGSGASVIATAGKVYMYANAMQMVHKAASSVWGNADDLRKMASTLDKIDTSVRASYKNKFVGTEDELKDLIAEETWLTAEECLAFGLCDKIIDEPKDEPTNQEPKVNVKENLFAKYQKNIQNAEPQATDQTKIGFFDAFNKNKEE